MPVGNPPAIMSLCGVYFLPFLSFVSFRKERLPRLFWPQGTIGWQALVNGKKYLPRTVYWCKSAEYGALLDEDTRDRLLRRWEAELADYTSAFIGRSFSEWDLATSGARVQ